MSLRIHFSSADVARTTFASAPDALWETLLSVHMVQSDDAGHIFSDWRRRVRSRLGGSDELLLSIAPPRGYSPDFLTPEHTGSDLQAGLSALARTPFDRIKTELDQLGQETAVPNWAWSMAHGDTAILRELTSAVQQYHRRFVAPHWSTIQAYAKADVTGRAQSLASDGFGQLMAATHPTFHWQAPTLEVRLPHIDRDLELQGRGLRFVPSFFCWAQPVMLRQPRLRPVLIYPVQHVADWDKPHARRDRGPDALVALLGRTRAQVLLEVARASCTTTELADRANISASSASEHARILHHAGLLCTRRTGRNVRHAITSTGSELVGDAVGR